MNNPSSKGSYRWVVMAIIMAGTFMAVLDSSIVNIVLPHIMNAFGVNREQIEWVSTAFMISTAVVMPLVAWLINRVGHKILYLVSLTLFTVGSAFCAFSWNYDSLVIARIMQAVGAGAIQPVGMAFVADMFEPHERGKALGIWATGIMVGPSIGPTLGGYLSDAFSWRMIFTINLPIGIVTILAGILFIRSQKIKANVNPFDNWGFVFLTTFLISSLLALSKGVEKGWTSTYILTLAFVAFAGLLLFIATEKTVAFPLLDLKLLRYRNFTLSMVLGIYRAIGLFGSIFLLPLFLQNVSGYTTVQAGLLMMPGALFVAFMMPIAGRLADRFAPNYLVMAGTFLTGISLFFYGNLDPVSSKMVIIGPQIIRGAGLALMMAPLMTAAINSVPTRHVPTVSGFLNISQNVGGSFGIAVMNSIVTHENTSHAIQLGGMFSPLGIHLSRILSNMSQLGGLHYYMSTHPGVTVPTVLATVLTIQKKATVLAFQNGFVIGGLIVLSCIPLCFFLQPTPHQVKGPGDR